MQVNEGNTLEIRDLLFSGIEIFILIFVFTLFWTETSNFRTEKNMREEIFFRSIKTFHLSFILLIITVYVACT